MKLIKILSLICYFFAFNAVALAIDNKSQNSEWLKNDRLDYDLMRGSNCQSQDSLGLEVNVYELINFTLCRSPWLKMMPWSSGLISADAGFKLSTSNTAEARSNIIQQSNFVRNHELPFNNKELTLGLLFDFYKKAAAKNIDRLLLKNTTNDYQRQKFIYNLIWLYSNFSFFNQDLQEKIIDEDFYYSIFQIAQKNQTSSKELLAAKNSYLLSVADRKEAEKSLEASKKELLKILNLRELPWSENAKIEPSYLNYNIDRFLKCRLLKDRSKLEILELRQKIAYFEIASNQISKLPNVFIYASTKYDKTKNLIDQKVNEIGLKISFLLPNKDIENRVVLNATKEINLIRKQKQQIIDKSKSDPILPTMEIIENTINKNSSMLKITAKNRNNLLNRYKKGLVNIYQALEFENKYEQLKRQRNILQYQKFILNLTRISLILPIQDL